MRLPHVAILIATLAVSCAHAQIGAKIQKQAGIHGTWHNNQFGFQMTLVLSPDGTGAFDGEPVRFTVQADRLAITEDGESTTYTFKLAGDSLTLAGGDLDAPITFSRAGAQATASSSSNNPGGALSAPIRQNPPAASGTGRTVPAELAGRWCHVNVTSTNTGGVSSDQCITLNSDGTYEYYSERSMSATTDTFSTGTSSQASDSGTWWVERDRIHYNSASRGPGSYQLQKVNHPKNGDPMIVLDGESFVTFYQRPPWP